MEKQDSEIRQFVLSFFKETPMAPLSLHCIVAYGERLGRRVGEWHAPSVTSRCISELVNEHLAVGLRSYCTVDMAIDVERIAELLMGAKVLVWIPMRLGVETLNPVYIEPMKVSKP